MESISAITSGKLTYRTNAAQFYGKDALGSPGRNNKVLLTDAAGYRLDALNNVITQSDLTAWTRKWAHDSGGNIVRHDGSGAWQKNVLDSIPDYNWPSGIDHLCYSILDYWMGTDKP